MRYFQYTLTGLAATALFLACGESTSPRQSARLAGAGLSNTAAAGFDRAEGGSRGTFGFTTIDVPGAVSTSPQGINARGDVVGTFVDASGRHGFLFRRGAFTTIDFPGAAITRARGISPRGEIVGDYSFPGEPAVNNHGFRRTTEGDFVKVDYPGHTNTIPQRILPDGTILGCRHDYDFMVTMRGIVISAGGSYEIGARGSMHNGATPGLRRIVGLYTNMATGLGEGYVIENGVFTPFIVPGSKWTEAWDINPRGEIVGRFENATGVHGFVRQGDSYATVDVPGAVATLATGINARGDVVGRYVAGGKTHGFLASSRDDTALEESVGIEP